MIANLSREHFRRQKLIEEQRKAGTLPAEVDEEGKAINPHIPHYIAQAPLYLDIGAPTLRHQRAPNSDSIAETKEEDYWKEGLAQEKANVKSKYEEDVFLLNHTSIWCSYWKDGRWGYACCHATYRNAYCMGRANPQDATSSTAPGSTTTEESRSKSKSLLAQHVEGFGKGKNSGGARQYEQ
ncbi:hypothetical protein BJ742DRAFT_780213 [Cladochytrium replicatum]|nr:hypothetical protein BJ742DRAFT_780213 [Cladochytrium replicatum]